MTTKKAIRQLTMMMFLLFAGGISFGLAPNIFSRRHPGPTDAVFVCIMIGIALSAVLPVVKVIDRRLSALEKKVGDLSAGGAEQGDQE